MVLETAGAGGRAAPGSPAAGRGLQLLRDGPGETQSQVQGKDWFWELGRRTAIRTGTKD